MPTWVAALGVIGVVLVLFCLCLLITPVFTSRLLSNLIVVNHTGTRICKVTTSVPDSNLPGADRLAGSPAIQDGASYTFRSISPGEYNLRAYDCQGNVLADDSNITLPRGNYTWIINPPQ